MATPKFAMGKWTPDRMFYVAIRSDGFDPANDDDEIPIPGESLAQLVAMLRELADGVELMVEPVHRSRAKFN